MLRATTLALFQHLNLQKWSDPGVFCTFSLRNRLRATTACNFSSLIWPAGSAPAALASLLFNPPEPQSHEKNTVFRDFPTFSRTCIFFLLIFPLLTLLPADCFFISPYCRKFDFWTSFDYIHTYMIYDTLIYIYIYTHTYIYTYIYIHIHIYIYTYIYI